MDHSQVSARVVAKVVLIVAAVVAGLYFAYLIREVIGLVLIAAFFAIAITPGGQLAGPAPRPPLDRDPARLPVDRGEHLRHRPADRPAAGQRGHGPLRRPARLRRRPPAQQDLPRLRQPLPHHPEAHRAGATSSRAKLGDAAGTLRDVTVGVFNRFVQLFSILVITFFLVKDGHRLLNFFYSTTAAGESPAAAEDRRRTSRTRSRATCSATS